MSTPEVKSAKSIEPALVTSPTFSEEEGHQLATVFPQYRDFILDPNLTEAAPVRDEIQPAGVNPQFKKFVAETANQRQVPRAVVKGMFDQFVVERGLPHALIGGNPSIVLFDGSETGHDPSRPKQILRQGPDLAVFTMLTGARIVEKSKETFYAMIGPVQNIAQDLSIDNTHVLNLPMDGLSGTVQQGFFDLLEMQFKLEQTPQDKRERIRQEWKGDPDKIAVRIRQWAGPLNRNHGVDWMQKLSETGRKNILLMMRDETMKNIDQLVMPLVEQGATVVLNVSNFDHQNTSGAIAAGDTIIPVEFVTTQALDTRGVRHFDKIGCCWFPDRDHPRLLLAHGPFFPLRDFEEKKDTDEVKKVLVELDKEVAYARQLGVPFGMVVHATPYWQYRNLKMLREGRKPQTSISNVEAADTTLYLIHRYKPAFVAFGQIPAAMIDANGQSISPNEMMVVRADKKGAPLIVKGESLGRGQKTVLNHNPRFHNSVVVLHEGIPMTINKSRVLPPHVVYQHGSL